MRKPMGTDAGPDGVWKVNVADARNASRRA
jgi:hypothetical protein